MSPKLPVIDSSSCWAGEFFLKHFIRTFLKCRLFLILQSSILSRYESNNTALQLALSTCDHMIESYDVLVALLETNALIHSDTNSLEKKEISGHQRAQSYRKSAESVAKHLLSRLDKTSRPDSGLATSHLDTTWEDSSGYSHTTRLVRTSIYRVLNKIVGALK